MILYKNRKGKGKMREIKNIAYEKVILNEGFWCSNLEQLDNSDLMIDEPNLRWGRVDSKWIWFLSKIKSWFQN